MRQRRTMLAALDHAGLHEAAGRPSGGGQFGAGLGLSVRLHPAGGLQACLWWCRVLLSCCCSPLMRCGSFSAWVAVRCSAGPSLQLGGASWLLYVLPVLQLAAYLALLAASLAIAGPIPALKHIASVPSAFCSAGMARR